jgi:tetratricopeptide (TPR) repeat protein
LIDFLVLLAGTLLSKLILEKVPESVASDAILDSGKALAGRIGHKDLQELIVESVKEAVKQSGQGYDDVRQGISKNVVRALDSTSARQIMRKRADATLLTKFSSEELIRQLSRELTASIFDRLELPREELESLLNESLRLFQHLLLRKIATDQKLTNLVGLTLGTQTLEALESIARDLEAVKRRTQRPFQSFTVLPLSDLQKLDMIFRYNPPQLKMRGYVRRKEVDFDPSGRKILLLGTPGSGKTTSILKMLERISTGNIVAIHRSFFVGDIDELINSVPLGEPIILVWDDLHWVSEPSLVTTVVSKVLEISSCSTIVLAARSNEFESLRRRISEQFWSMFEQHRLLDLDIDQATQLVDICKQEFKVTIDGDVEARLVSIIKGTDPTPLHVVSAMVPFKGRSLEVSDVHTIPFSARDIWIGLFARLDADKKNVLRSLKLLDSAELPPLHWIVSSIYECVFLGDAAKFSSSVDELGAMGWIRSVHAYIQCHDLQLEATQIDDLSYGNLRFLPGILKLTDEGKFVVLHHLGIVLDRRGKYDDARALFNESLAIERKLSNHLAESLTLHHLGKIEQALGNYDDAERLYEQSLEIKRKLKNEASIPSTLHQLGNVAYLRGNYDDAKRLYTEAMRAFRQFDDQSGLAGALHQLALIEKQKGNYGESIRLTEQSLAIARKLGDQEGMAPDLALLANLEQSRGNYDSAKRWYAEAESVFRELGDAVGLAAVLHQLSMIHEDEGDLEESLKLCTESLRIEQRIGNQLGMAGSLHQLGKIEFLKGNYDEAQRFYEASLEITRKLGNQSEIASTIQSLGVIAYMKGIYDEATKLYNQALEVFRSLGIKPEIASTLYQFGNMEVSKGNYDDAKKLYEQCLEIDREVGNQLGIARTLGQLGNIDALKGHYDTARKLFDQSLAIVRKLGNRSGVATAMAQLGSLAEAEGNLETAVKLWSQALQVFEQIGEREKTDQLRSALKRIQEVKRR